MEIIAYEVAKADWNFARQIVNLPNMSRDAGIRYSVSVLRKPPHPPPPHPLTPPKPQHPPLPGKRGHLDRRGLASAIDRSRFREGA